MQVSQTDEVPQQQKHGSRNLTWSVAIPTWLDCGGRFRKSVKLAWNVHHWLRVQSDHQVCLGEPKFRACWNSIHVEQVSSKTVPTQCLHNCNRGWGRKADLCFDVLDHHLLSDKRGVDIHFVRCKTEAYAL